MNKPNVIDETNGEQPNIFLFDQGMGFPTGYYDISEERCYVNVRAFGGADLLLIISSFPTFQCVEESKYVGIDEVIEKCFSEQSETAINLKKLNGMFLDCYKKSLC